MDIDTKLLIENKKEMEDNKILSNFSKIVKSECWENSKIYSAILKDLSVVTVISKDEGFNMILSNKLRYLKDDTDLTLMSLDRVMYYLDVIASEVSLTL